MVNIDNVPGWSQGKNIWGFSYLNSYVSGVLASTAADLGIFFLLQVLYHLNPCLQSILTLLHLLNTCWNLYGFSVHSLIFLLLSIDVHVTLISGSIWPLETGSTYTSNSSANKHNKRYYLCFVDGKTKLQRHEITCFSHMVNWCQRQEKEPGSLTHHALLFLGWYPNQQETFFFPKSKASIHSQVVNWSFL